MIVHKYRDVIRMTLFGRHDKNINDGELPLSIEVVPHKAILIANVDTQVIMRRNDIMFTIYKCVFITFFAIPLGLVLISFFVRMP